MAKNRLLIAIGNTLWNALGQAVPMLAAFFAIPIAIRFLGSERFGIITLWWVILGYLGGLDLGVGRATTKFAAELASNERYRRRAVATSLVASLIVSLVPGVILFVTSRQIVARFFNVPSDLHDQTVTSLQILAVFTPVLFATGSMRGILEGMQKFGLVNAIAMPISIANYLIPAVAGFYGSSLTSIVTLLCLTRLMAFLFYLYESFSHLGFSRGRVIDKILLKELFVFGGWVMVSNIIGPIVVYVDRFMVTSLLSVGTLSCYVAPYELAKRLSIIPGSFVAALFPIFSETSVQEREHWGLYQLYVRSLQLQILFSGPLCALLVLFAGDILNFWLGGPFVSSSTRVLQVLALGMAVNAIATVAFTLIQGVGRPDLPAKLHTAELVFAPLLCWLLVSRFGIVGAAYAWSARAAVDALGLVVIADRLVPDIRAVGWRGLTLLRPLISLMLLLLSAVLIDEFCVALGIWGRALYGAVMILTFFAFTWFLVLEKQERGALVRLASNFCRQGFSTVVGGLEV